MARPRTENRWMPEPKARSRAGVVPRFGVERQGDGGGPLRHGTCCCPGRAVRSPAPSSTQPQLDPRGGDREVVGVPEVERHHHRRRAPAIGGHPHARHGHPRVLVHPHAERRAGRQPAPATRSCQDHRMRPARTLPVSSLSAGDSRIRLWLRRQFAGRPARRHRPGRSAGGGVGPELSALPDGAARRRRACSSWRKGAPSGS